MQARLLLAVFDSVYLFALTAWLGSVLFFSFGVAPVIFRTLGAEAGGRFVRALFPRYYAWGVVSSAICLPAFLGAPLSFPEFKGWWVGVQAMLIIASTLIFLYCGNSLTPAINVARDAGPAGADRFDQLHRRSVRLNAVALVIGIVLLVAQATRRTPLTSGIRELSPEERASYDRDVQTAIDENAAPRFDAAAKAELDRIFAEKREREARRRGAASKSEPVPSTPQGGR